MRVEGQHAGSTTTMTSWWCFSVWQCEGDVPLVQVASQQGKYLAQVLKDNPLVLQPGPNGPTVRGKLMSHNRQTAPMMRSVGKAVFRCLALGGALLHQAS